MTNKCPTISLLHASPPDQLYHTLVPTSNSVYTSMKMNLNTSTTSLAILVQDGQPENFATLTFGPCVRPCVQYGLTYRKTLPMRFLNSEKIPHIRKSNRLSYSAEPDRLTPLTPVVIQLRINYCQ